MSEEEKTVTFKVGDLIVWGLKNHHFSYKALALIISTSKVSHRERQTFKVLVLYNENPKPISSVWAAGCCHISSNERDWSLLKDINLEERRVFAR